MTRNDGVIGRNRCAFGYSDREWADFALGLLDPREAAGMEAHAALCGACAGRRAEWLRLTRDGEPWNAATAPPLPERRRLSLRRVVRATGLRRRLRGPAKAALGAAAVLLLVAGLIHRAWPGDGLFGASAQTARHESPGEYLMQREPEAGNMLSAPDTTQFRVVHVLGTSGEGYIWLSGDAREALLYLNGLPDTDLVDYQAWAVRGAHADSLGVLKHFNGIAHLHIRSMLLPDAQTISLSAEPKGGSDQPTSPPAALVLFEARR
jgi:hypothetical protein